MERCREGYGTGVERYGKGGEARKVLGGVGRYIPFSISHSVQSISHSGINQLYGPIGSLHSLQGFS